jgi:hypothetical protein
MNISQEVLLTKLYYFWFHLHWCYHLPLLNYQAHYHCQMRLLQQRNSPKWDPVLSCSALKICSTVQEEIILC